MEAYVRVDTDKVNATSGRDELGRNVWKVSGNVKLEGTNANTGIREAREKGE